MPDCQCSALGDGEGYFQISHFSQSSSKLILKYVLDPCPLVIFSLFSPSVSLLTDISIILHFSLSHFILDFPHIFKFTVVMLELLTSP